MAERRTPRERRISRRPRREGADRGAARLGLSKERRFAATALVASVLALVGSFSSSELWVRVAEGAAVVVSMNLAAALAHRVGARAGAGAVLALLVGASAVLSAQPVLLAGAAVGTAVMATVLGVLATRRAGGLRGLTREVVIAVGIALIGGIATTSYRAPMAPVRARYLVLGIALIISLALVHRLGAGIHGLGRRGWLALAGGAGTLFVTLAYTEALSRWGSASLRSSADDVIGTVDQLLGAVPRPTIFLIGVPALLWGVSTRSKRRQGWWATGFGATALAAVSTMFLQAGHPTFQVVLSLGYSVSLGLVFGGLAIALDGWLTGPRGRRASRSAEPGGLRPEPARNEPLF